MEEIMNKKRSNNPSDFSGSVLSNHLTQRHTDRAMAIAEQSDRLSDLSSQLQNVGKGQAQGNLFEQIEVIKFNQDALQKDSSLFAETTASLGMPTAPADIIISDGQKQLREIQAKSYQTAESSANALSSPKYKGMGKLLPTDQKDAANEYLDKRISTNTIRKDDLQDTKNNLQGELNHDDISSSGTTRDEAIAATDTSNAQRMAVQYKAKAALTDMHKSGLKGGQAGAAIAGGITAISGTVDLIKGEADAGEVITSTAISAGKGFATGYAVTALSKGITHTSSALLGQAAAKSLLKSNAATAIAAGVVNAGKSMISYMNGDIDKEELFNEINHIAITGTSSFYYAALGQAAIPIPVVGAVVGGMIGYYVGNILHQSSLIALGESQLVKEAKEKRALIQSICDESLPRIRDERAQLESLIESHFSDRKDSFLKCFNALETSIRDKDDLSFIETLNIINSQFETTLQFTNFEDFDDFMESDEDFVF